AAADGSTPARRVDFGLASNERVGAFELSGDGARVLFVTTRGDLYCGPTDGSSAPLRIGPSSGIGVDEAHFAPPGARVVFTRSEYPPRRTFLCSVPSTGGTEVTLASETLVFPFRIAADGARVVLLSNAAVLYSVPIEGGTLRAISGGTSVDAFELV